MAINDRFTDAPWVTPRSVIIGGAGGIGSWLTLFLSRIGYEIYLYDDDLFEEHNMGGQFVNKECVGISKVDSIAGLVTSFGGTGIINTYHEKYLRDSMAHEFMFSAFDNMQARNDMFESWFEYNRKHEHVNALFIDGRLTMEQLQIFCVTPSYTKMYREKHLFSDEEVADAACTMKQTSHSAAMIASHMTGFFTNHITNIVQKSVSRDVPFQYEYFIPLNLRNDEF